MDEMHRLARAVALKIVGQVGRKIVMAVPLGLGKPIAIINALYQLALEDTALQLTFITGLTLARPVLRNTLEKRFIEPILSRLLNHYEDPLYEQARMTETLPSNIRVLEFYLSPGKYLQNLGVQQDYISCHYTQVVRNLAAFSINVMGTQVVRSATDSQVMSLSSNSDLFHETVQLLLSLKAQGQPIALVAEVNAALPFMLGEAVIQADIFTDILELNPPRTLFPLVREAMTLRDQLIGLYTSTLIPDGACLQVGIGKLSNALANALILRQEFPAEYQSILNALSVEKKFGKTLTAVGSLQPLQTGLYASTEMLSDEYMQLFKKGLLKKRVYDHVELQALLNANLLSEWVTEDTLALLVKAGVIHAVLTTEDLIFLKQYGIVKHDASCRNGQLIGDLLLGQRLQGGKVIHAGFFLGSADFYQQLRTLSPEERALIDMTTIARTNALSWSTELLRLQRTKARFVNTAMMVTVTGHIISDGLREAQEVSGVGGQFDFIEMAFQLDGARSIINCHSVRDTSKGVETNLLWEYPNITAPRSFRDIVVTEYGIADCRYQTDSEVIKRLLNITDTRFQAVLLKKAKRAGKIEPQYQIPQEFCANLPSVLEGATADFQNHPFFQAYPFGSDMTEEEQVILKALMSLKKMSLGCLVKTVVKSLFVSRKDQKLASYLARLQLDNPRTFTDYCYRQLFVVLLRK